MQKVVTIGGGGGHAQVLRGLKRMERICITGICPNTDSGGSTGMLRHEYGAPGCLGDLTKCMVALGDNEHRARALMYRFESAGLAGHSVKNVLFLGLVQEFGFERALEEMRDICGFSEQAHNVLPVTLDYTELHASLSGGNAVVGETRIDLLAQNPLWHPDVHAIDTIFLAPPAYVWERARDAVASSDVLIVCPGDLYSSILPVLLPEGMQEAISEGYPRIIMVLNIMTKRGETDQYTARDFINRVEEHMGRPCDVVLANSTTPPDELVATYRAIEQKVVMPTPEDSEGRDVVSAPLLKITEDGELYHDPEALARELQQLL